MTDDRLKLWLDFSKWFFSSIVITGGIAWATTIINAKHKDIELAIKKEEKTAEIRITKYEKEMSYLENFLETAVDSPLEKRHKFAQYLAHVITSPEYKIGWESYLKTIEKDLEDVRKEQTDLEEKLTTQQGQQLLKAQKRISELSKRLAGNRYDLRHSESKYTPIKNLTRFISDKIICPKSSVQALTFQQIHIPDLQEYFPSNIRYVAKLCVSNNNKLVGPFVAYYENGEPIQTGFYNSKEPQKILVYYPDGQLAAKWMDKNNKIITGSFQSWLPTKVAANKSIQPTH